MSIDSLGSTFEELSVTAERPRKRDRETEGPRGVEHRVFVVARSTVKRVTFLEETGEALVHKVARLETGTRIADLPKKQLTKKF